MPGFGEIVETQVRIVASPPTGTDPEPPSDAEFRKLTSATEERGRRAGDSRRRCNACGILAPEGAHGKPMNFGNPVFRHLAARELTTVDSREGS